MKAPKISKLQEDLTRTDAPVKKLAGLTNYKAQLVDQHSQLVDEYQNYKLEKSLTLNLDNRSKNGGR